MEVDLSSGTLVVQAMSTYRDSREMYVYEQHGVDWTLSNLTVPNGMKVYSTKLAGPNLIIQTNTASTRLWLAARKNSEGWQRFQELDLRLADVPLDVQVGRVDMLAAVTGDNLVIGMPWAFEGNRFCSPFSTQQGSTTLHSVEY